MQLSHTFTQPSVFSPAFDYVPRTRLVYGADTLEHVGAFARELGGRRALLVTDPGIVAAGHAARAVEFLEAAGLSVHLYDQVRENPTTADVARCVDAAKAGDVNVLVGLGGGSSMDTAKGCNFILTNGGEMKDYWGVGKAAKDMLPLIAIPTTAGTGSECQSAALIADEVTHQKMACLDPKAAARVAILDPTLTLSQPPRVSACTGVDAIAHAVETAVTRKRTALSAVFSREAFRLCFQALPKVLAHPGDVAARGEMLLGAAYAGMAIENSMLGAAHSAANPLTAHHGVVHGQAVGLMLPHIVRFNSGIAEVATVYAELASAVHIETVSAFADALADLVREAGLRASLASFGVRDENIPALAEEAERQWTAQFNPRKLTKTDFAAFYEEALP